MFKNKSIFNRTLYIGDDDNFEKFEVDGHVFNYVVELKQEIMGCRKDNVCEDYKPEE